MEFREEIWPVTVQEVTVCQVPGSGIVVVSELQNLGGESVRVCLTPDQALEYSEDLRRAYLLYRSMGN